MTASSLAEFLLARIAEDEDVARESRPHEHLNTRDDSALDYIVNDGYGHVRATSGRVLAECKRVAVDWYLNDDDIVMSATVKAMAAVYADHPDYRDEWKP